MTRYNKDKNDKRLWDARYLLSIADLEAIYGSWFTASLYDRFAQDGQLHVANLCGYSDGALHTLPTIKTKRIRSLIKVLDHLGVERNPESPTPSLQRLRAARQTFVTNGKIPQLILDLAEPASLENKQPDLGQNFHDAARHVLGMTGLPPKTVGILLEDRKLAIITEAYLRIQQELESKSEAVRRELDGPDGPDGQERMREFFEAKKKFTEYPETRSLPYIALKYVPVVIATLQRLNKRVPG